MQVDVVSRLVPGVIITSQSLGSGRLIMVAYETKPRILKASERLTSRFGIYLVENYNLVDSLCDQGWDAAVGFMRRCYRDADGENETWWRLICGRVREQRGGQSK